MTRFCLTALLLILLSPCLLFALPVPLGELEIGLESFDGYQEGLAYLSTDEDGTSLEIRIAYKGFGLDYVSWTFSAEDLTAVRDASANAAWWRSRLLEMNISQTVTQDAASASPQLLYSHRGSSYPFDSPEHVFRFVRQGRDYAVLLTESSPGAETRRSGDKILPVFVVHFMKEQIPAMRDMLSEDSMSSVLNDYAAEQSVVREILSSRPE